MVARLGVFLGWLVKTGMFVATTEKVTIQRVCYPAYFHFYKTLIVDLFFTTQIHLDN